MHRPPIAGLMVVVTAVAIDRAGLRADEPTGSIRGTIKIDLYPLPKGRLSLHAAGAPPRTARIRPVKRDAPEGRTPSTEHHPGVHMDSEC